MPKIRVRRPKPIRFTVNCLGMEAIGSTPSGALISAVPRFGIVVRTIYEENGGIEVDIKSASELRAEISKMKCDCGGRPGCIIEEARVVFTKACEAAERKVN